MTHRGEGPDTGPPLKPPWLSLATTALFLIAFTVMVFLTDSEHRQQEIVPLIGILLLGIQQGTTSLFAERNHQRLSNGFMNDKMVNASKKAIEETGVVTRQGPAITAEILALQAILTEIRKEGEGTGKVDENPRPPAPRGPAHDDH